MHCVSNVKDIKMLYLKEMSVKRLLFVPLLYDLLMYTVFDVIVIIISHKDL